MIYIVQSELRIDGRLVDMFTHSFAYDNEEKAKEFVKRQIADKVNLNNYTQVNDTTVEHVDFAGSKTTHKYIIESLVKDF